MLARGLLPLLVRAAEWWMLSGGGQGELLAGLASARLLTLQPLWDVAHLAFCAACVWHHQAMRAQLMREKQD
jgi:NAD(P)H-hydrate repair Nnr-like enzyme with NAD(P)H-hydrate dehydratase domain